MHNWLRELLTSLFVLVQVAVKIAQATTEDTIWVQWLLHSQEQRQSFKMTNSHAFIWRQNLTFNILIIGDILKRKYQHNLDCPLWLCVPGKQKPYPFTCHWKWLDTEIRLEFHRAIVTVIHTDFSDYCHNKHHSSTMCPVLMDCFIN